MVCLWRLIMLKDSQAKLQQANAVMIEEEEEVYLQIQKALKPMRIQTTIIYIYIVMTGTVLICIK